MPAMATAQEPRIKNKKYQGLLWEITGNGLKKPSYLFGTMHVSSKIAFHLADSFYMGIKGADVVALETNPETWQEDLVKYNRAMSEAEKLEGSGGRNLPQRYLREETLKFFEYEKRIEEALQSNPSAINSLLYRSYGNMSSDFEEDTYLDMYIYQCGKRWGKKVAGVENYDESMRLMAEAYLDAANDKNKKPRFYDRESGFSSDRLQESYRTGNLDWLDSINHYNSTSAAFDEKFLYQRNDIQANGIDSILRSGLSLFVGVGAAHLPGERGVIEILRARGYQLRPVKMGSRDSEHKKLVEKLRVPVSFKTWNSEDGLLQVDVPGTLFAMGEGQNEEQRQYADMANGSYYMMTRILTNAWLWNHNTSRVQQVIDSLLYENIPGRIISKETFAHNGYPGIKITNRTRRGDVQRYQIYVTPFEVIIFKLSGTGDYVLNGDEADRFFGSIKIKPYVSQGWQEYTPTFGGFSISLPHQPFIGNDGSWIFDAVDSKSNTQYRVMRTDVPNHYFASEDSFDLGLMEESFSASEFIEKRVTRKNILYKSYPALEASYRDKSGKYLRARFIIQGPNYYTLIARGDRQNKQMDRFFQSFSLEPWQYQSSATRIDTSLYFTVNSPVYPELDSGITQMPIIQLQVKEQAKKFDPKDELTRSRIIRHDSTGEQIYVEFAKLSPYESVEDEEKLHQIPGMSYDTSWIVRNAKSYSAPGGFQVREWELSDTGSSRMIWHKRWYKEGLAYNISAQLDTLSRKSQFLNDFFQSFRPLDSLVQQVKQKDKVALFLQDFNSGDSLDRRRAISGLDHLDLDSTHLKDWMAAIKSLEWKEKDYLDVKKEFIGKLAEIRTEEATRKLLDLYHVAGDTLELQNAVLETLLRQETEMSFRQFRDIVMNEPPIIEKSGNDYGDNFSRIMELYRNMGMMEDFFASRQNGSFFDELSDSLKLSKTILPDLLPLLNLEEYRKPLMKLMSEMIDSSLLSATDYSMYYSKFMLEARMAYRKLLADARTRSMAKALKEQEGAGMYSNFYSDNEEDDSGEIPSYMKLLLPFHKEKPAVADMVSQMLKDGPAAVRFDMTTLLLDKGIEVPDSILLALAKDDRYRYRLYSKLHSIDKLNLFPSKWYSHELLALSELKSSTDYSEKDTLVYVGRLSAKAEGREGYVYFFKYGNTQQPNSWKIATAGLVPTEANQYLWPRLKGKAGNLASRRILLNSQWTDISETRLLEDEPLKPQLEKQLRKLYVMTKESGRRFYEDNYRNSYY